MVLVLALVASALGFAEQYAARYQTVAQIALD